MATVDSPRSKKQDSQRAEEEVARFPQRLHIDAVAAGLAVYFAPLLIANSPLRNRLVQSALKLDGTITVGSASLGWFSEVTADQIEIRDSNGEPIVEIGQLRTAKPLIGLLLDFGDVGGVDVDRLVVHVVCEEKDTNLERVFAQLIKSDRENRMAVDLKIHDGTLDIEDVPTARAFRIEHLTVDCAIADDQQPIVLAASGDLTAGPQPGKFALEPAHATIGRRQKPAGQRQDRLQLDCRAVGVGRPGVATFRRACRGGRAAVDAAGRGLG